MTTGPTTKFIFSVRNDNNVQAGSIAFGSLQVILIKDFFKSFFFKFLKLINRENGQ